MIKKIVLFLTLMNLYLYTPVMASDASRDNLKVAYIYNFIKYIEWTEAEVEEEVFHVCAHEKSELKTKLVLLEKKSIRGKSIEIISISKAEELTKCEMLVLPQLEHKQLKMFTESASSFNTLTVSDTPGYAHWGVMINLIVVNDKIRFEVNLNEVESAGFTMSSNLLKLAKIVKSEGK